MIVCKTVADSSRFTKAFANRRRRLSIPITMRKHRSCIWAARVRCGFCGHLDRMSNWIFDIQRSCGWACYRYATFMRHKVGDPSRHATRVKDICSYISFSVHFWGIMKHITVHWMPGRNLQTARWIMQTKTIWSVVTVELGFGAAEKPWLAGSSKSICMNRFNGFC